jgi:catechol 2,3-dioxygenase
MKVQSLGHVVIKVRNQQRAEAFYTGVLGLPVAARLEPMHMTFFTLGNHHDVAVMAVEDPAPDAPEHAPGLFHAAFKVGDAVDQRREAKAAVDSVGLTVKAYDHGVTKAIYIPDPDGNTVEL